MEPGETVRVECGECLVVHYICLALPSEWPEIRVEEFAGRTEPTFCPFCASNELKITTSSTSTGGASASG